MILGASAIRAALESGAIVCDPAPARVEGAHIDVTLGSYCWVWTVNAPPYPTLHLGDADPWRCFSGPWWREQHIEIPPHGFVLTHTREAIGTAPGSGLLPTLHTRSTLARWGLGLHPSAGWGDEGYAAPWTLEIINPHPVAVSIPVGARVGCVAFEQVQGETPPYEGRYNVPRADWTPAAMLPRKGNW